MSHATKPIHISLFTLVLAACGARIEPTDTSTSWLATCGSSAECSDSLVCLCGVCTLACDDDDQCASASASAVCRTPDDECSQAASLCLAASDEAPEEVSTQVDTLDAGNSGSTDVDDTTNVADRSSTEPAPSTIEPVPSFTNATDAGPTESPAEICDGSDDVRFVYLHDASGSIAEQNFVAAHGWRMLTIDGKCNFWTTNGYGTLYEGTFEPEALEDLRQSHYGKFATYPKEELDCADSSQRVLWDPYGSTVCWCECDSDSQPERKAAFEFAQALFDTALPATTASEGDLQMLVLNQAWDPAYPLVEWPLTFDPRQVAEQPEAVLWTKDSGTLVVAGPDAELLRAATTSNPSYFRYVDATADAGTEVELLVYLRDEPPAKVLTALDAARDENRPGQ